MDEEYGASYINIEDDEGNQFELEHLDTFQLDGEEYTIVRQSDILAIVE